MKRFKYIRCHDRMCGADDCPTCHPESFRGGVFIDDTEAAQDAEADAADHERDIANEQEPQ